MKKPCHNLAITVPSPVKSEGVPVFQLIADGIDGDLIFHSLVYFFDYIEHITGCKIDLKTVTSDCFEGIAYAFNKLCNGKCFGSDNFDLKDYKLWTFNSMSGNTNEKVNLIIQWCFNVHVVKDVKRHFEYLDKTISNNIKQAVSALALHTVYNMRDATFEDGVKHASIFCWILSQKSFRISTNEKEYKIDHEWKNWLKTKKEMFGNEKINDSQHLKGLLYNFIA